MKQNGMNKVISLVCVAMLVLALPVMGLAADGGPSKTKAVVEFKEGELKWDAESMNAFDLNFDVQEKPVAAVTYDAVSTNHKVVVNDPRVSKRGWDVTVQMGDFVEGGGHSFTGTINLLNGAVTGTGGALTTGITVVGGILVNDSATPVATAEKTTSNAGQFNIVWAAGNQAKLNIAAGQTVGIKLVKYVAELTWTLTAAP